MSGSSARGGDGRILGIIPARGGSKGIPHKNARLLAGRPLLEYTACAARDSGILDRLILTTDSEEIAEIGRRLGIEVPFLRPSALAQDDTPMVPVLEHTVGTLEEVGWSPTIVVLLQPTAPLRQPNHVVEAVRILREGGCDSVASVVEVPRHFSPDYVMRLENEHLVSFLPEGAPLTRRQDARAAYSRDGTVYAVWRDVLMKQHSLYGSTCRPLLVPLHESLNIDTLDDWAAAEQRLLGITGA